MSRPRVSCLMITRDRPEMAARAVEQYRRQSWPEKELVVVVDRRGTTDWVDSFRSRHGGTDVRIEVPPAVEHLGALRNVSVDLAKGPYVAVWDDDDLHHPERLEAQATSLLAEGADVSFLEDSLEYFQDAGDLFLLRWLDRGLPSTMLSRKDILPRYAERISDPKLGQRGSDSPVQRELFESRKVSLLRGRPYLYTRVYHGANLWNRLHHVRLSFEMTPDDDVIAGMIPGLADRLREVFPFSVPGNVMCRDGGRVSLEGGA